ncbi:MAG: aminotransferase class V-fold PLP-dependent enzyme [SAR324 cluster bacterium]|nr:aminotransferase class V-fold PLP-dependent enzyme [SAR324 cluster bacterium]
MNDKLNKTEKDRATAAKIEEISKKFFVGPGNDDTFKMWCETAVDLALDWLKNPEKKKIHAEITLQGLTALFSETKLPQLGLPIEEVFAECKEKILDNSVRINNPRFIGHMTTVIPWFSVVVDILISAINQNQVKIETALASTFVERQTLSWLHRLVYDESEIFYQKIIQDPTIAVGNTVGGGTIGNLNALAVARESVLPGIRKKGTYQVYKEMGIEKVAILASERVHYSMAKSVAILGLGEDSVVKIPVDRSNKMDPVKLQAKIDELKAEKTLIMAVVGIAGTTETGNLDPLEEMAKICKKEKIWFHVDAAWGGALLLCNDLKKKLKGIEQADSVVLDGHKLFYMAMSHSAVLFKKKKSLDTWRQSAAYIIRKGSVDIGKTTLEGSRRFNSLKLWFSLKMLGGEGYQSILKRAIDLSNLLAKMVDKHPDFECTSVPEVCILTYRYVPAAIQKQLAEGGDQTKCNRMLNQLNVELQKRQRENGESFISRTTLESTGYKGDIVVLRAVLTNILTKPEYLVEILAEQKMLGDAIYKEILGGW